MLLQIKKFIVTTKLSLRCSVVLLHYSRTSWGSGSDVPSAVRESRCPRVGVDGLLPSLRGHVGLRLVRQRSVSCKRFDLCPTSDPIQYHLLVKQSASDPCKALFPIEVRKQFPGLRGAKQVTQINVDYTIFTNINTTLKLSSHHV